MLKDLKNKLAALHRDERGADMIEYILIVAVIGLPLLAVIVVFRKRIAEWIGREFNKIKSGVEGEDPESDF